MPSDKLEDLIGKEKRTSIGKKIIEFIVLFILISILLKFRVINRLKQLADFTSKVQLGDYKEIIDFKGNDEVSMLCHDFNLMSEMIQVREVTLHKSEQLYRTVSDSAYDAIVIMNGVGEIEVVNPSCCQMFGYCQDELIGTNITQLMPERYRDDHVNGLLNLKNGKYKFKFSAEPLSLFGLKKNNLEFPILLTVSEDKNYDSQTIYIGSIKDETLIKYHQEKLDQSQKEELVIGYLLEQSLRARDIHHFLDDAIQFIVKKTPWLSLYQKGGIFLTSSTRSKTLLLNATYNFSPEHKEKCRKINYENCICGQVAQTEELIYNSCIGPEHRIRYEGVKDHGHYVIAIKSERAMLGVMVIYLNDEHPYDEHEVNFLERVASIIGIAIQRFQYEEEIEHKAYYDELTDLPNRQLLLNKINKEVSIAERHGRYGAILFIDLDNFKVINDNKGHAEGDDFLIETTHKIRNALRQEDTLSRIGGDEFVILLPAVDSDIDEIISEAGHVAEKVRETLEQIVYIQGDDFACSGTIGIAIIDGKTTNSDSLLSHADTAMYSAKNSGKNRIAFFESSMQEKLDNNLLMEKIIREALKENLFQVYYQPQVSKQKVIIGAEALLRLNHSVHGWISPGDFIHVAECSGLIKEIDLLVLSQVIKDISVLIEQKQGSLENMHSICVNVSSQSFEQDDFIENLISLIPDIGILSLIPIAIELTERVMVNNPLDVAAKMNRLKDYGFKVSLDDFGTGYSSLSYLTQLPIDILKIDIAFVRDIHLSPKHSAIASSILTMSEVLGLHCIAEGVEVSEEFDFLVNDGCPAYQGYHFYKPMPFTDFLSTVAT